MSRSKRWRWLQQSPLRWQIPLMGLAAACVLVLVGLALRPAVAPPAADDYVQFTASPSATSSPEPAPPVTPFNAAIDGIDGPVQLAAVGSSLTAGQGASEYQFIWPWRLKQSLGENFEITVLGFPGHTVQAMRDAGAVAQVGDAPIVFFEPGTPNNFGQSLGLEAANANTVQFIAELRAQNPSVTIIGIVPSPIADQGTDETGASYADYIGGDRAALAGADMICDIYSAFTDIATQIPDGVHPNDAGNEIWANALMSCIMGSTPAG